MWFNCKKNCSNPSSNKGRSSKKKENTQIRRKINSQSMLLPHLHTKFLKGSLPWYNIEKISHGEMLMPSHEVFIL